MSDTLGRSTPEDFVDATTPLQRRIRGIGLGAGANVAARGASTVVGIVIVPIALSFLGKERYGIWLTISASLAVLGFMDLGLGNAVMTAVARARSGEDRRAVAGYVSTGFFVLLAVAVVGSVAFVAASGLVSWTELLGVPDPLDEIQITATVVFILLMANLPLGVAGKTEWGMQEGYISSMWQIVGSAISLVAFVSVVLAGGGLPWIALAIAGGPVAANFLNSTFAFGFRARWLRPRIRHWNTRSSAELIRLGAFFFGLQFALVAVSAVDNLVIAWSLGASAVPDYAIPYRMFAIVTTLVSLAITPLWPAYGDAFGRREHTWIRSTLIKSIMVTIAASSAFAAVLLVAGNTILEIWTSGAVQASGALLLGLGVWNISYSIASAISIMLNAATVIRYQLITFWCMAVAAISAKVLLVPVLGIEAVAWSNALAFIVCMLLPNAIFVPRFLRGLERGDTPAFDPEGGSSRRGASTERETID